MEGRRPYHITRLTVQYNQAVLCQLFVSIVRFLYLPWSDSIRPVLTRSFSWQILILPILLCAFWAEQANAGTFGVFGPEAFVRTRGEEPDIYTASFPVLNPDTTYTLKIYNGGKKGSTITGTQSSSTILYLNGALIQLPNDFKRKKNAYFERQVNLLTTNEIQIILGGKPRSVVALEIEGVDNAPPLISASVDLPPNAAGWNNTSVRVSFECSDAISGIASCPQPVTVDAEGANQVISGTAEDHAGNTASASVTLNIDKTPPAVTAAGSPAANAAGWNNADVTVGFEAVDALSGVATVSEPVVVTTEGASQVITGSAVDKAGNTASAAVTLNIDKTPPTLAAVTTPEPNASGWHNTDVTVSFDATDTLSGLAEVTQPVTVTTEGENQVISGNAVDKAGNTATATASINIDKTPPGLSATTSPAANAAGWNNADVTVSFEASDALSGIAEVTEPVVVTTEGAGQEISGTATDAAGNTASAGATVSLDKTAPVIAIEGYAEGDVIDSEPLVVQGTVSDENGVTGVTVNGVTASLAGDSFTASVPLVEGPNTLAAIATDVADNTATTALAIILETNKAPVLTEVPPQIVAEGEAVTVEISAADADGDDLTFSTEPLPGFATFTDHANGSATLELAPGFADAGEYAFLLSVADPTHTVSQTVNISVTNTNRGPELAAVGDYTITENEQLMIPLSATDPDAEPLVFSVTGLPAFGALADNGDGTATITLATNYDSSGQYPLTVTVTDSGGISATTAFQVTVNNINRSPVIVSQPVVSAAEGSPYTYPVIVEDPDADSLQFSLTEAPAGMGIDSATGLVTWTPGPYQDGTRNVQVQVADGQGGGDAQAWQIEVSTTVDRIDPSVTLIAPESALVGSSIIIEAQAHDNVGVERVLIYVDGVQVRESTQPPHNISYNMPSAAGQTLTIRAVAVDAAGNEGEALASVMAVDTADDTPPVIHAVYLSPSAAPAEQVTIRAEVSDDRGVKTVTFSHAGSQFGAASAPAYDAVFPLPADSEPGTDLTVVVAATDTSGNTASSEATLTVASEADEMAPEAVTVTAPPVALAGQTVPLSVSAIDNIGLLKVVFFGDGVVLGEDPEAPFELQYPIPVKQPIGSQIDFVVRAIDFSGNATDSEPVITEILAPGEGFIVGEVYDDSTGLPVVGARVRLHSVGGREISEPPETVTDIQGGYRFPAIAGLAVIVIELDGYTRVYRAVEVLPDEVNIPLDARLTPLNPGTPINYLAGATLAVDETDVQLQVPAGAVSETSILSLTALSGQGLPAPLPNGWVPVAAVHAGPEGEPLQNPAALTIAGAGNPDDLIATRWDADTQQWLRIPATLANGGWSLPLSTLGTVALLRADIQPVAPAVPAIGAVLSGVAGQAIPDGTSAAILPSPKILFMQPDAYSDVTVLLDNGAPLPSGTRIEVDFQESYERIGGISLWPSPMAQDFILYQGIDGFVSHFVASPSEVFDPSLLKEGVISLAAHRPAVVDGWGVVGAAGGVVRTLDGHSLNITAGALSSAAPVSIQPLTENDPSLMGDARFTFIAGVNVDLGGKPLAASAELTVPITEGMVPDDAQVLLVHPVHGQVTTHYVLAGIASVNENTLTVSAGTLGLPLPGIHIQGRYYLVQMNEPVGYITGTILSEGTPETQVLVVTDTLPFGSQTAEDQTHYVLAGPMDESNLRARSLIDGNSAAGIATLTQKNQIATLDLDLTASRPSVVAVSPVHGAIDVPASTSITVQFSGAMDPVSINIGTLTLRAGETLVNASVNLLADGTTAVIRPAEPLQEELLYQLILSGAITDTYGSLLQGNQPDGSFSSNFKTADVTPPSRPPAGQVTMAIPNENGIVTIRGTAGTVEPTTLVTAINETTGAVSSAQSNADGSFLLRQTAGIADSLTLVLRDQAGNETRLSPGLFDNGNGEAVVGSLGGTVRLPDGSEFNFAPGSFEQPAQIEIQRLEEAELPVPTPTELGYEFAAGFSLYTESELLSEPLQFKVPVDQAYSEDDLFLVCMVDDRTGTPELLAVEIAQYKDGYLETASPPWPGIRSTQRKPSDVQFGIGILLEVFLVPVPNYAVIRGRVISQPVREVDGELVGEPVAGVRVQTYSAFDPNADSTPLSVSAETDANGVFALHTSSGSNVLFIMDPLTGTGTIKELGVPYVPDLFTILDFTIVVAEGLFIQQADIIPPTLFTQVIDNAPSGERFKVGNPIDIEVTAVDESSGVRSVSVRVNGDVCYVAGPSPARCPPFTPEIAGDLEIIAEATDNNYNWTTRRTVVSIRPADSTTIPVTMSGDFSMADGTEGVPLDMGLYAEIAQPLDTSSGDVSLSNLQGVDLHFKDVVTGTIIEAIGGTACEGSCLRLRPKQPLPPCAEFAVGNSGTTFKTQCLSRAGTLPPDPLAANSPFDEIRGIAIAGDYAYVANYVEGCVYTPPGSTAPNVDDNTIRIVDIKDPNNLVVMGNIPVPAPRGVAIEGDKLVVVGGGGCDTGVVPYLWLYSLFDPTNPSRLRGIALNNIPAFGIPINVRLSKGVAYVSTSGIGLQVVPLDPNPTTGSMQVTSGFRLPNANFEPNPLTGASYDSALLPGLAITGGLDNSFYTLISSAEGYVKLLPLDPDTPFFELKNEDTNEPLPILRFASSTDYLLKEEEISKNINLVAVSHGNKGVSLVNVTKPDAPTLLSTIELAGNILDIELLGNWLITGDRLVSIDDPEHPVISSFKLDTDSGQIPFTAGGDVAIKTQNTGENNARILTVASSNSAKNALQVGEIPISPAIASDWGVIRTAAYEPHLHPDNLDYLYTGDPVNPFTGEFVLSETDLTVPGRGLDFSFTRTYRSRNLYNGSIGFGWDHNYNTRLTVLPRLDSNNRPLEPFQPGDVIHNDGAGRATRFELTGSGYTPEDGVFAELTHGDDEEGPFFRLIKSDGIRYTYRPSQQDPKSRYLLSIIADRNGNSDDRPYNFLRFLHDERDRLMRIRDTMGRDFYLSYDIHDRITAITDYIGRAISYRYDYDDNLVAVTTPPVMNPEDNQFLSGKTTRYTYSWGFQEYGDDNEFRHLNHNLLSVTDPKGQKYLELTYFGPGTQPEHVKFDRVRTQYLGEEPDGGLYHFDYRLAADDALVATTINRSGNHSERYYNANGQLETLIESATVRGKDVDNLSTSYEYYEPDGLLKRITSPRGLVTDYVYDSENGDRLRQADVLVSKISPPLHDIGTPREYRYVRGPWGEPTRVIDPAGNVMSFDVSPEGAVLTITHPKILRVDGTTDTYVETFTYGRHGEILSITDADGVTLRFEYYKGVDPNGDGDGSETFEAQLDDELDTTAPGYLRAVVADSDLGGTTPRNLSEPPLELSTLYTYDAVGNRTSVTDSRGNVTIIKVNELNQVYESGDERGTRRFEYDENDNLAKAHELGGLTIEYVYDSLDLLVETIATAPVNGATVDRHYVYGYDPSEHPTLVRSPLGHETVTVFDARGLPIQVSTKGGENAVDGVLHRSQFDEDGNVTSLEDGEGYTTSMTYNGFNELLSTTDPNGNQTVYTYDPRGYLTAERRYDAEGQLVAEEAYLIDAMGRVHGIRETLLGGLVHTGGAPPEGESPVSEIFFYHDGNGRVLRTEVQVDGETTRAVTGAYDSLGRLVREEDAEGNHRELFYNGPDLERIEIYEKDPLLPEIQTTTHLSHDQYGRLTERIVSVGTADQRITRYGYDERDNVIQVEAVGGITTSMQYDGFGRMATSTTGRDHATYDYDLKDRLVGESDAQGRGIQYEYDGRDRLTRTVYADGSTASKTYYQNDLVATFIDRAGNGFTHTYDPGSRLAEVAVTRAEGFGGTTREVMAYDALDRTVHAEVESAAGARLVEYQFNSRGDVLAEQQNGHAVHSSYNLVGERVGLQHPTALELALSRDSLGRIDALLEASPDGTPVELAGYRFSGPRRFADAKFGNGTSARIGYNLAREEQLRTYFSPTGTMQSGFTFGRDPSGRLIEVDYQHLGNTADRYAYTPEGWLESALYGLPEDPAPVQERVAEYTYDASGNRLMTTADDISVTYLSDVLNQYATVGEQPLSYDGNGNLRDDGSRKLQYDAFNRLLQVTDQVEALLARYEYDALGRRVGKVTRTMQENYLYDGDRLIAVESGPGQLLREYVYAAAERPVFMYRLGAVYYYQYDQRGSVVAITDGTGAVVERYVYDADGYMQIMDAFDMPISTSLIENDFGYAGAWWDPDTGLLHMGARDYAPELGRFLQTDPLGTVDGLNLYAYAGNDPVNFVDPLGLFRIASVRNINLGTIADARRLAMLEQLRSIPNRGLNALHGIYPEWWFPAGLKDKAEKWGLRKIDVAEEFYLMEDTGPGSSIYNTAIATAAELSRIRVKAFASILERGKKFQRGYERVTNAQDGWDYAIGVAEMTADVTSIIGDASMLSNNIKGSIKSVKRWNMGRKGMWVPKAEGTSLKPVFSVAGTNLTELEKAEKGAKGINELLKAKDPIDKAFDTILDWYYLD